MDGTRCSRATKIVNYGQLWTMKQIRGRAKKTRQREANMEYNAKSSTNQKVGNGNQITWTSDASNHE